MGKLHPQIDRDVHTFLTTQKLFFVATAPTEIDATSTAPRRASTPSASSIGVETIAHVRQNGRIVIMFCAFEGAPRIVRLHGRGTVIAPVDDSFETLAPHFEGSDDPAVRAIIRVDVDRISDSCGFGVPLYRYEGQREQLPQWARRKGAEGLRTYQRNKNAESIDGLDGLSADYLLSLQRS